MPIISIDGKQFDTDNFNTKQSELWRELQHANRLKEDASYTMVVIDMRIAKLAEGIVNEADEEEEDKDLVDDIVD